MPNQSDETALPAGSVSFIQRIGGRLNLNVGAIVQSSTCSIMAAQQMDIR